MTLTPDERILLDQLEAATANRQGSGDPKVAERVAERVAGLRRKRDAGPTRRALIRTKDSTDRITAYLPKNYKIAFTSPEGITIEGYDYGGWTLDHYVIPRLASGLYYAEEVEYDELAESEFTACAHPGRYGCGTCDACCAWGDEEYDRLRDEGRI